MLSSSKQDKGEAKFVARLDVLTERVDTLAQTVATTASGMAKKDGEIAALRKELDARDERLADFITKTRAAAGGTELIELKEAVAVLAKERGSKGGGASPKQLDDLVAKVGLLGQRLETLSTTVATTAAGLAGREGELATIRKQLEATPKTVASNAPDPAMTQRVGDLTAELSASKGQLDGLSADVSTSKGKIDGLSADVSTSMGKIDGLSADVSASKEKLDGFSAELVELKLLVEQRAAESQRPSEEIREMLTALRSKVEELAGFRAGVTEEELEQRLAEAGERVQDVAGRIDTLAATLDSAVATMSSKEEELATLHRHFTESSERIESGVGDIRAALAAFPDPGAANVDELVVRMDRVAEQVESFETTAREAADASELASAALANRIEAIEQQVVTVANEVERAKTLWPVALRSLEARLDDATSPPPRPDIAAVPDESPASSGEEQAPATDLLAGLRDSLQAMESVAAEMARASDTVGPATPDDSDDDQPVAAAGGGTIVPLRSPDG